MHSARWLCLTCTIDVIDEAVKAWHFPITTFSLRGLSSPSWLLTQPPYFTHSLLPLCISFNSQSVQTTSRSCSRTIRLICWSVEQERLTLYVPLSEWDTQGRWVPRTEEFTKHSNVTVIFFPFSLTWNHLKWKHFFTNQKWLLSKVYIIFPLQGTEQNTLYVVLGSTKCHVVCLYTTLLSL